MIQGKQKPKKRNKKGNQGNIQKCMIKKNNRHVDGASQAFEISSFADELVDTDQTI